VFGGEPLELDAIGIRLFSRSGRHVMVPRTNVAVVVIEST
jgi:hypothetical protein